jgi:FHA domain
MERQGGTEVTAPRLAQVEVVDADGRGTRLVDVQAWPLRIGRALDNDLVLPDPHVAAHHATVQLDAEGRLQLRVGDCRNGVRIELGRGQLLLSAGEQAALPVLAHWHLGHSQLLLRRPEDPLPAELPLTRSLGAGLRWLTPVLVMAALAWLLASRWIGGDDDAKWNDYLAPLLAGAWYPSCSRGASVLPRTFAWPWSSPWPCRPWICCCRCWPSASTGPC